MGWRAWPPPSKVLKSLNTTIEALGVFQVSWNQDIQYNRFIFYVINYGEI